MAKPLLQLLHMAAPCLVQAAPVLGEPFGQLHMLAARDNMCAWLGVQVASCMAGTINVTRVDSGEGHHVQKFICSRAQNNKEQP